MRTLLLGLALVALAGFAGCGGDAPPPARAAAAAPGVTWSPTSRLSSGVDLRAPAVGVAASGAALAAFSESPSYSSRSESVLLSAAPAGAPFAPAVTLAEDATAPALAVAADGQALLTFAHRRGNGLGDVVMRRGTVDGAFGPEVRLRVSDPPGALALAPDGTALMIVDGFRRRQFYTDVHLIDPDGRVGRALHLGTAGLTAAGSLAVGPEGTIALVALGRRTARGTGIRVLSRAPGGRLRSTIAMRGRFVDPQVAVGPGGRIAAVATRWRAIGEAAAYGGVVVAERRPGARRFTRAVSAPVRPRRRPYAFDPTVAFDAAGHRVVAWTEDADPRDTLGEAEDSRGVSWAWSAGRRFRLDGTTREITLAGTAAGVLALTDSGPWRASVVTPQGARRVPAPRGRASDYATSNRTDRALLASPARVVFGFVGTGPEQIDLATGELGR